MQREQLYRLVQSAQVDVSLEADRAAVAASCTGLLHVQTSWQDGRSAFERATT